LLFPGILLAGGLSADDPELKAEIDQLTQQTLKDKGILSSQEGSTIADENSEGRQRQIETFRAIKEEILSMSPQERKQLMEFTKELAIEIRGLRISQIKS
jgi:hypothetical protein